jgi:hypothetical protein
MRFRQSILCGFFSIFLAISQASAWGPDGHHAVGAIADNMIAGTQAAVEVKAILGTISLQDASVWADCAKGIDPKKDYAYTSEGQYPECKIFETPQEEAAMSDFVRRNDTNCSPKPGEGACHNEYHYTDVAIQRDHYDRKSVGTRDDDVVAATVAATRVLKGEQSPAPFNIKDKREALLLLAHYVGDLHQPLHVGAVYLDAKGQRVDPDKGTFDPKTDTHGGNNLLIKTKKMHSTWDAIPASLNVSHISTLLSDAQSVALSPGQSYDWPVSWADETIAASRQAFTGLKFGSMKSGKWPVTLPTSYSRKMTGIKKTQLEHAGAHLAQLLNAIWP